MAEEFNTQGMLDIYLFENRQLLERLQEIVLEQKDEDCFDEDGINEIFRTMHTIKGSSGVMMFDDITKLSHKLEDVFYYLRESKPQNVPHMFSKCPTLSMKRWIRSRTVMLPTEVRPNWWMRLMHSLPPSKTERERRKRILRKTYMWNRSSST